jgi:hypothetical protein
VEVLEEVTLESAEHLVALVEVVALTIPGFLLMAPSGLRDRGLPVETLSEGGPGHLPQVLEVVERVPRVATLVMQLGAPAMAVPEQHHRFWAPHISLEAVVEVAHIRVDLQPRQETVEPVVVEVEPLMLPVEQLDWVVVAH